MIGTIVTTLAFGFGIYYGKASVTEEEFNNRLNTIEKTMTDSKKELSDRLRTIEKTVTDTNTQVNILVEDKEANKEPIQLLYKNMYVKLEGYIDELLNKYVNISAIIIDPTTETAQRPIIQLFEKPMPSPFRVSIKENSIMAFELPRDIQFASIEGLPKNAIFDPKTNILVWRPRYDQVGSYDLEFNAVSQSYSQKVTIDVEEVPKHEWFKKWLEESETKEAIIPLN